MPHAALLLSLFLWLGCSARQQAAPELVGTWTTSQTDPDGVHGTSATYTFKADGTFEMSGYPPIKVKGRWQVTERAPGRLRLKLTEQDMTGPGMGTSRWNDQDAWGDLGEEGRSFTYQGKTLRRSK